MKECDVHGPMAEDDKLVTGTIIIRGVSHEYKLCEYHYIYS